MREESGVALVVALMTIVLLMALGAALVLVTTSETMIAANFRAANEALYAADAALARALTDLKAAPDWDQFLAGDVPSSFVDGPPTGTRTLVDGSTINLAEIVNMANCHKASSCTNAEMNAKSGERQWGANNPRWRIFTYGRLADSSGTGPIRSPYYVVTLISDDPSENDEDPAHDGGTTAAGPNLGAGILLVRAEAFGPHGGHRIVVASVARVEPTTPEVEGGSTSLRVLSWSELF